MIIQIIIISAVLAIMIWFLTHHSTQQARAWKKVAVACLTLLASIVVLFPELANDIAHKFGVGRGADLLLYLLVLAFIGVVLTLYIKHKEDEKRLAILARKIALLEAKLQKPK